MDDFGRGVSDEESRGDINAYGFDGGVQPVARL